MKVVVTGSEGFLGKYVCGRLTEAGHEVIPFDVRRDVLQDVRYKWHIDCDAIVHLAALISIKESFEKPQDYYMTNTVGTALLPRDKKVIMASSLSATSGNYSPYAHSKWLAELALPEDSIAFRISNMFGEGENHIPESHIIPKLLNSNKEHVTIYQDGQAKMNYIHVSDVAEAIKIALEVDFRGVYNLTGDYTISLREIAETLNATNITYVSEKRDSGDVLEQKGDSSMFKERTGWKPEIDVRDWLKHYRIK